MCEAFGDKGDEGPCLTDDRGGLVGSLDLHSCLCDGGPLGLVRGLEAFGIGRELLACGLGLVDGAPVIACDASDDAWRRGAAGVASLVGCPCEEAAVRRSPVGGGAEHPGLGLVAPRPPPAPAAAGGGERISLTMYGSLCLYAFFA